MAFFDQRNITKTEARKILGNKYSGLSDKELEQLLEFIYTLCTKAVKQVLERKHGREKVSNLL
jgi:hypothetical protein